MRNPILPIYLLHFTETSPFIVILLLYLIWLNMTIDVYCIGSSVVMSNHDAMSVKDKDYTIRESESETYFLWYLYLVWSYIRSYPILFYPILYCIALSNLMLPYPVLYDIILSYPIPSYVISSDLILSCLILSYVILSYSILSYLMSCYLIQSYLVLSYLMLPYHI